MELTRRSFIKILAGASAALVLPIPDIVKAFETAPAIVNPNFNPEHEYGQSFAISTPKIPQGVLNFLFDDMKKSLPAGTPFEIRASAPNDYSRTSYIAWYYSPVFRKIKQPVFMNFDRWEYNPKLGYFLLGRGVV